MVRIENKGLQGDHRIDGRNKASVAESHRVQPLHRLLLGLVEKNVFKRVSLFLNALYSAVFAEKLKTLQLPMQKALI